MDLLGNLSEPAHYSFTVQGRVPIVTSPTHPDPEQAYVARDVVLEWTVPDKEVLGYYYVFDQVEDTVPTTDDVSMSPRSPVRGAVAYSS